MSIQARADLGLILISLLWGGSFLIMKDALGEASTVLLLAIRFTLAFVMLLAVDRRSLRRPEKTGLGWITAAGLLLATAYVFQTAGLHHTTPGKSAFLTGLYIVAAPLLSAAFAGYVPRAFEWAGVALAVVGMSMMAIDDASLAIGRGELFTLVCAVLFAGHLLVLEQAVKTLTAHQAGLLQIGICSVALWLLLPFIETPHATWSPKLIGAIVFTAALATALPFTLLSWAQKHTSTVRAALLMSMEMPFAGGIDWLVNGQLMTKKAALGAALILVAVLLVELWRAKVAAPSPPAA